MLPVAKWVLDRVDETNSRVVVKTQFDQPNPKVGDVVVLDHEDGSWAICKLLKVFSTRPLAHKAGNLTKVTAAPLPGAVRMYGSYTSVAAPERGKVADAVVPDEGGKVCSSCGKRKPETAFAVRKDSKDGRRAQCKECSRPVRKKGQPTEKKCSRCQEVKPLDAFHKSGSRGLQPYCKPCRKEYQKVYFAKKQREEEEAKNAGA